MDYFEIRIEDQDSDTNWIANHRHDFMCKVYERIGYAIENNLEKAKLFRETIGVGSERKVLRSVNIYLKELKGGTYLKNTMLVHFERIEDYEKCANITKWIEKLSSL